MAATTATALPSPSLLDRKIKHRPSKKGMLAFLSALAAGVVYIVFHVAHDLNAASITSYAPYMMLGLALVIALGFEFVNGFHDTANAVATVIYTHSLEPNIAVVWSGICNLAGVLLSSGTVAFAVITLLPVELILQVSSGAGFSMVFALLIAAILWNLGTWWLGLPASSSHTMVGLDYRGGHRQPASDAAHRHVGRGLGTGASRCLRLCSIAADWICFRGDADPAGEAGCQISRALRSSEGQHAAAVSDPRFDDRHLHRCELLSRIERRPEGDGADHAHPHRNGADGVRA